MILSSSCCVQFFFSTVHYDACVTRSSRCEPASDLLKFLTLPAIASLYYGRTLLNLDSSSLEVSVVVDKTVHLCISAVLTGSGTARRMQADGAIARQVVVVNCGRGIVVSCSL